MSLLVELLVSFVHRICVLLVILLLSTFSIALLAFVNLQADKGPLLTKAESNLTNRQSSTPASSPTSQAGVVSRFVWIRARNVALLTCCSCLFRTRVSSILFQVRCCQCEAPQ